MRAALLPSRLWCNEASALKPRHLRARYLNRSSVRDPNMVNVWKLWVLIMLKWLVRVRLTKLAITFEIDVVTSLTTTNDPNSEKSSVGTSDWLTGLGVQERTIQASNIPWQNT